MRARSHSGVSRTALAGLLVAGAVALSFGARAADNEPPMANGDLGGEEQMAFMPGGPGGGHRGGRDGDHDRCGHLSERLSHVDKKLSSEQVRDILAGRLAQSGEGNLKVGKVRANGDVVAVDIVTTSGSLVVTREISAKTGLPADLVQRCQTMQAQRAAMHPNKDAASGTGADGKATDRPNVERHHDGMRGPEGMRGPGGMRGGMGHGGGPDGMRGGMLGGLALVSEGGPGRDLKLTADQAKKLADAALVIAGNPHLKVGPVKEKDADTLTVDIVTQDNALVIRREVNRHTGHFMKRPA